MEYAILPWRRVNAERGFGAPLNFIEMHGSVSSEQLAIVIIRSRGSDVVAHSVPLIMPVPRIFHGIDLFEAGSSSCRQNANSSADRGKQRANQGYRSK